MVGEVTKLGSCHSLPDLNQYLTTSIQEFLKCDMTTLFKVDYSLKKPVLEIVEGDLIDRQKNIPAERSYLGYCLSKQEAICIPDAKMDHRVNKTYDTPTGDLKDLSLIGYPLKNKEGFVIGVIEGRRKHGKGHFSKEDERMISVFSEVAAVVYSYYQNLRNPRSLIDKLKYTINSSALLHTASNFIELESIFKSVISSLTNCSASKMYQIQGGEAKSGGELIPSFGKGINSLLDRTLETGIVKLFIESSNHPDYNRKSTLLITLHRLRRPPL